MKSETGSGEACNSKAGNSKAGNSGTGKLVILSECEGSYVVIMKQEVM